jgi:hypothetical protein
MNYQEPYRIHQIDFNNLIYTKIKTTESKKIIFIKYQDNKKQCPLVIQLPSLLNINEASKVTTDYHELEIPLLTQESDKALLLFNFFEDLDKKMMTDAKINSHMWFDTLTKKNSVKYKKIVRESDVFTNGVIKIKIIKNNDFETMLQIDNKTRINVNKIPNNYWCKMLIEVYALVINAQTNTFSIFLRPIMLSFKEKQSKIYNYKFLEDSDSDKDEMDVPDSELSSIFMKQKEKSKNEEKLNDMTSSQIFIKDQTILQKLNEDSSDSTSSDDNYERKNKSLSSSSSSDEKFKKLNEKSSDTSSESANINSKEDKEENNLEDSEKQNLKKMEESEEEQEEDIEKNNLQKLENELKENKLKLSESSDSSMESSDKIKLTDSSSEEENLNKIKNELNSIK